MELKSLDRINEVLGKMSVSEAEEVVEKMGGNGMLSMEQGVIDGTTEEGKKRLEELEKGGKGKERKMEEVDAAGLERKLEGLGREKEKENEVVEVADVD